MGNLISLAIAGTAAFAAAPLTTAVQSAGEPGATPTDAAVFADFGRETGKMRPELHSSGFGPLICSCPQSTINDIRAMGFKASRTHDWAPSPSASTSSPCAPSRRWRSPAANASGRRPA